MKKKGIAQISGVIKPIVGKTYTYQVTGWYPDTEADKRNPEEVTWELFKQRKNGKFTSTRIRKKGISDFTFGEKAVGSVYRLEAYLYGPEGGGLIIRPQPGKTPEILKVDLLYTDGRKGSTFSFMEKLTAKAYCTNLLTKELTFTLWEDDAKGPGHHTSNKPIETKTAKVNINGTATVEFVLTKALMKKAMQGEPDPKELEFYVTAEYYVHKKHATGNVEIKNPFPPLPHEIRPRPTDIPKAKNSPAASKPPSAKEDKGIGDIIADKTKELWDWWETKGTIKKEQPPTRQKPEGRSPAMVKEQQIQKTEKGKCFCNRDFTVNELKDLVAKVKGITVIWEGVTQACNVNDKSWEGLTSQLNAMFRKYNINRCMQKISFLAQVYEETGLFRQTKEETSNYKSSISKYKGRGLLQITGEKDSTEYYNNPGPYRSYGKHIGKENEIVNTPDLISDNLSYTIDVGGWIFSVNKKVPLWKVRDKYSKEEKEAVEWKINYFSKGLGKTLNELGYLMEEEEEKYFFLQSKILNGYGLKDKLNKNPIGWNSRKNALVKLKVWFKYDKNICNGSVTSIKSQSKIISPPWMEIAWREFNKYKNQDHNNNNALQRKIEEYFDNTDYASGTYNDNWCAAFVTWCLNKGNPNYAAPGSYGAVRARAYSKGQFSDHSWEKGKLTKNNKPAYGATAMIVWDGGGQHVAFVIGKSTNGNIAILGGNQSVKRNNVKVGRGITKTTVSPSNIKCYMYPEDFNDNDSLYDLNSEDITDQITSRNDTHAN